MPCLAGFRVSPRWRLTCSLLRQRKVSKRKATRSLGPFGQPVTGTFGVGNEEIRTSCLTPLPDCESPFCMRRGAQGQTDQGPRLSEPKASSSGTPAGLSTAGCPQRSEGTQTAGSPFLCLLSFGEAKESESLSGDSRHFPQGDQKSPKTPHSQSQSLNPPQAQPPTAAPTAARCRSACRGTAALLRTLWTGPPSR